MIEGRTEVRKDDGKKEVKREGLMRRKRERYRGG